MKYLFRFLLLIPALLVSGIIAQAQLLSTTPEFSLDNSTIVITCDMTKGNKGLMDFANTGDVYVHVGLITDSSTSNTDWRYVKFTNFNTPNAAAKATYISPNKYEFTITNVRTFFGVTSGIGLKKIAILFRNGAGSVVQRNADGSDMYISLYSSSLAGKFKEPAFQPLYTPQPEPIQKTVGDAISVNYLTNKSASITLRLNGTVIQSVAGGTSLTANPVITTAGANQLIAEATDGPTTRKDTVNFFVAPATVIEPLPAGVRDGINYEGDTAVTLVLFAPNKKNVVVVGDFSNWSTDINYQMKKTADGKYFWLRIGRLTPGTQYGYQYLIDGSLKIADYYAELILDPDRDGEISSALYPGLKPYPIGRTSGLVSVIHPGAPKYNWKVTNFSRPDKKNLLIYEMLVRDFVATHDYKTIRDTLTYLKRLGINTLELMPVMEFEGNSSWGYNTSFYFAPDKFYGRSQDLKELIDSCHSKGIAVILDLVLNHTFGQASTVQMYFNSATGKVSADNPWYNVDAPHAFGFGYDLNHESDATKYLVDRIVEYWLKEFKVDGFRLDFTKGLTQKASTTDGQFSTYDASRINILKRINATAQANSPGAYVILEHFCENSEEKDLALDGMMIWGNGTYTFNEASMGYVATSNFQSYIHSNRGYIQPLLLSYMESHDEERLTFKNFKYGATASGYNIKNDLPNSLKRQELVGAFYMAIPGPKMVWQFGELGYDISRCYQSTNGEGGDCNTKLDPKPIRWDYYQDANRRRVYELNSSVMRLRQQYPQVFTANNNVRYDLAAGFKVLQLDHSDLNVTVIGNFGTSAISGSVTFQKAGTWYNYVTGETITATGSPQSITLAPGEYRFYLDKNVSGGVVTSLSNLNRDPNPFDVNILQNPLRSNSQVRFTLPKAGSVKVMLLNQQGQVISQSSLGYRLKGEHRVAVSEIFGEMGRMAQGVYIVRVSSEGQHSHKRVLWIP